MDFRVYWGWEPPPAHRNRIFRRRATHARTHTSGRLRWPAQNETAVGMRPATRTPWPGFPPAGKIIIRTNAFVESCHTAARGSGVAVAAVCDARDLMGEVGLAEGVSSVALLVSK
jgi:hypothetical protein